MKTKKLLVMSNFVEAYRDLVRNAYNYYVAFEKYDLSIEGNTEREKLGFLMKANYYATRAIGVYDSAFYTDIRGLASNLLGIEKIERKKFDCLDDNATMDNIQDWTWDEIENQIM